MPFPALCLFQLRERIGGRVCCFRTKSLFCTYLPNTQTEIYKYNHGDKHQNPDEDMRKLDGEIGRTLEKKKRKKKNYGRRKRTNLIAAAATAAFFIFFFGFVVFRSSTEECRTEVDYLDC